LKYLKYLRCIQCGFAIVQCYKIKSGKKEQGKEDDSVETSFLLQVLGEYSTLMDIEQTQSYKRAHTEGKDI
jgi:hypothetical protein